MIAATAPFLPQQDRRPGIGGVMLRLRVPHGALYDGSARGTGGAGQTGVVQQQMAFRINRSMTDATDAPSPAQGIEGVLLDNRTRIIRFLQVRGAGDAAEDLFQDLWMRLTERQTGPIAEPLSYVMRAANNLMLDRYRSARQSDLRDKAWGEAAATQSPSTETALISREQLALVEASITATGERPARIFRRFRVDGQNQRDIASEMGVSLSTVEADLRKVYAALAVIRRQFDAS
jgi:RNA polymerase sigma-70 factor (ECF subfamily)